MYPVHRLGFDLVPAAVVRMGKIRAPYLPGFDLFVAC